MNVTLLTCVRALSGSVAVLAVIVGALVAVEEGPEPFEDPETCGSLDARKKN